MCELEWATPDDQSGPVQSIKITQDILVSRRERYEMLVRLLGDRLRFTGPKSKDL